MVEKDSEFEKESSALERARRLATIHEADGGQLAEWRRTREREDMDEREVERVVRSAAESVYGVTAVVGAGWTDVLAARLGVRRSGIKVVAQPALRVAIDLRVADTVPAAQVAANVAEKVRYIVEREFARPISELTIRVDGRPIDPPAG